MEGAYGKVHVARGGRIATKVIRVTDVDETEATIQRRLTETKLPHLVAYVSHAMAAPGLLGSISMRYIEGSVPLQQLSSRVAFLRIYFQVVWTLHRIRLIYPTFRHNDLSTQNVLVRCPRDGPRDRAYDGGFILPASFEVFICDFGLSWIPGLVENREALLIQISGRHGFTAPWRVDTDLYRLTTTMLALKWHLEPSTREVLYRAFNGLLDDLSPAYANNYFPVNRDSAVWCRLPTARQLLFATPLFDSFATTARSREITLPTPPPARTMGSTGTKFDQDVSLIIDRVYSEPHLTVRLKLRRLATGGLERHYKLSSMWPEMFAICAVLDAAGELGVDPDGRQEMCPEDWYRAANLVGTRPGCLVDVLIQWNWATKK